MKLVDPSLCALSVRNKFAEPFLKILWASSGGKAAQEQEGAWKKNNYIQRD